MQGNKEKHITTIRSEAERVINHTLPVRHSLTEVMGVQHYIQILPSIPFGIKGCKYKTSSWHFNRFPDADNIGSTV